MSDRTWLAGILEGTGPVYLRIVDALARARTEGVLQPGDRLPAQRDVAEALGIDLTTVTRAFSEARRRNLVEAVTGRGTFITPGGWDEPVLDLSMNIPPAPSGINLPLLIRNGVDAILKRSSAEALLSYHPGSGSNSERAAGSLWLSKNSARLPLERVIVGSGAQALLAASVMAMTAADDIILADRLTYPGLLSLARASRRIVAGVACDDQGVLPDALEKAVAETSSKLLYLNPTLHNPTAVTMPESRRRQLIKVARKSALTILEDDPYSRLLDDPPSSFLELLPKQTLHVATLAKCISPFLRTAFLVAPDAEVAERIGAALRGLTLMAPPLMTGLAAEWIRSGLAGDIVSGVRAEAAKRRALAESILASSVPMRSGGLSVWLDLQSACSSEELVRVARRRGLAVSPAEEFATSENSGDGVRLSLGAAATRSRLADGLRELADVLALARKP